MQKINEKKNSYQRKKDDKMKFLLFDFYFCAKAFGLKLLKMNFFAFFLQWMQNRLQIFEFYHTQFFAHICTVCYFTAKCA